MPAVFLRHIFRWAVLGLSFGTSLAVSACPAGQREVCVAACFCVPAGEEGIGSLYDSVSEMAAAGLHEWIVRSRNAAATGDVRPIPLNIRAQLEPYYDLQVLDTARYRVGDDVELNAAHAMLQNPDVNAVTLMDIIVFRNADDALDNVALWAHELKHVQQYLQWGVGEFATRYTRDHQAVEAPAYAIQAQVAREVVKKLPPTATASRRPPLTLRYAEKQGHLAH